MARAQASAWPHRAALAAAGHAIEHFQRRGKAINYTVIALSAGVSRTWLHRQDQIRDQISELRQQHAAPAARGGQGELAATTGELARPGIHRAGRRSISLDAVDRPCRTSQPHSRTKMR